jgi:hypothetical protein
VQTEVELSSFAAIPIEKGLILVTLTNMSSRLVILKLPPVSINSPFECEAIGVTGGA